MSTKEGKQTIFCFKRAVCKRLLSTHIALHTFNSCLLFVLLQLILSTVCFFVVVINIISVYDWKCVCVYVVSAHFTAFFSVYDGYIDYEK